MNEHDHHDAVMRDLGREFREILDGSAQGVYVFLDDHHKLCNARFATMLGYRSADDWARVDRPFPDAFVADESHETLIPAYFRAMDDRAGSAISVTWKRLGGGTVDTDVLLVPIAFGGHHLALHFVDERFSIGGG